MKKERKKRWKYILLGILIWFLIVIILGTCLENNPKIVSFVHLKGSKSVCEYFGMLSVKFIVYGLFGYLLGLLIQKRIDRKKKKKEER